MVNIFNEIEIPSTFFIYMFNISDDLWHYINDNLYDENYETFRWELNPDLTTNVNGKYI